MLVQGMGLMRVSVGEGARGGGDGGWQEGEGVQSRHAPHPLHRGLDLSRVSPPHTAGPHCQQVGVPLLPGLAPSQWPRVALGPQHLGHGEDTSRGGRHGPRRGLHVPITAWGVWVFGKLGVPSCLCSPPPQSWSPETAGPFPAVLRGHGACPQGLSTALGLHQGLEGGRRWEGNGDRNGVRTGTGMGSGQGHLSMPWSPPAPGPGPILGL